MALAIIDPHPPGAPGVTAARPLLLIENGENTAEAARQAVLAEASADAASASVTAAQAAQVGSELARDQAADLVLPENIFVDVALATAEAAVAEGTTFKIVDTATGLATVYLRTAVGSDELYPEATSAALASTDRSKGAALIGWMRDAIGAVARTVGDIFDDQPSVMDFIPLVERVKIRLRTSTADLSAYMAAAMTHMGTLGGGELRVPNGTYTLTDQLTVPTNVRVKGDGAGSIIKQTATGKNIFVLGENCEIESLWLEFPQDGVNTATLAQQNAVYADGKNRVAVRNCFIKIGDLYCGIQLRNCLYAEIDGNRIWSAYWQDPAGSVHGDIILYGTGASSGGRLTITNNFCLSNNSQGIGIGINNEDADIIVSGNVCVTCEPDGVTLSTTNRVRRHGIVASYQGSAPTRAIISNNLCRNTQWTGIYAQGEGDVANAKLVVEGNICSGNGYSASATLSGGIYIIQNGGEVVKGNIVLDFQGVSDIGAAIRVQGATLASYGVPGTLIEGNLVMGSLWSGIGIGIRAVDVTMKGNTFYGNTQSDLRILTPTGVPELGGHLFEGNTIHRTNTTAVAMQVNTGGGTRPITIRANVVYGLDNTTNTATNAAIQVKDGPQYVTIEGNRFERFHRGIDCATALNGIGTRLLLYWDRNEFVGCATGIGANAFAGATCFVVEGNKFRNTTTRIGAASITGVACGFEGQRLGEAFLLAPRAAAPTIGTWAVGDEFKYLTPAAGGKRGEITITAGNPGTWKPWGPIDA